MIYKSLPAAFLFQMIVGLLCVYSMLVFGPAWLATLAILGLRPFLFEQIQRPDDKYIWQFYHKITKVSIVATAVTIIVIYLVFDLFSHSSPIRGLWLLTLLPYFIFVHGAIGFIYSLIEK